MIELIKDGVVLVTLSPAITVSSTIVLLLPHPDAGNYIGIDIDGSLTVP